MRAGGFRTRVTFQEVVRAADGGGGAHRSWVDIGTVWGRIREAPGREGLEGGQLQASAPARLQVRSSSFTRSITTAHRVRLDGEVFNIRAIGDPDHCRAVLELSLERGVAT